MTATKTKYRQRQDLKKIGLVVVLILALIASYSPSTKSNKGAESSMSPDVTVSAAVGMDFEPLYDPSNPNLTPWKEELFKRLDRIRFICGSLCTNLESPQNWRKNSVPIEGANLRLTIARDVDCPAIVSNLDVDAGDTSVPFPPPSELLPYYSMGGGGQVAINKKYTNIYLGTTARTNTWGNKNVNDLIETFLKPEISLKHIPKDFRPTYSIQIAHGLRDKLRELDIGSRERVLVIGSERPWVECIILALGAKHVTTLEYGVIDSRHAQIDTMTPNEMRKKYAEGTLPSFDAIVTYSSVEHSGLGRYGDALNPWGDLLAIARAWCVTTDDALMVINVPTWQETIEFNAHRWYGPMRYSLLATNWVQIDGASHPNGPKKTITQTILAFRKVSDFTPYLDYLGQD